MSDAAVPDPTGFDQTTERSGRERLGVTKTYKLYIGGALIRSESGRVYRVDDADGSFLANAARASRKDVREAVSAADKAFSKWSSVSAYNRGQILFRIAEMLEGRKQQLTTEVAASEGTDHRRAISTVELAIDRTVWYAGWTDKFASVFGSANPVAGPYFSFSTPEPTGVVGVLAPRGSSLLGLLSVILPVITSGNTCVVVASQPHPLPAITLAEILNTSDLPAGVVNILTGYDAELAPTLAAHATVRALDLTGADSDMRTELEHKAADTVKRVPGHHDVSDWTQPPGAQRIRAFTETKTVWHPVGT